MFSVAVQSMELHHGYEVRRCDDAFAQDSKKLSVTPKLSPEAVKLIL
jgi:hypothetical protein